jgi:hypothetical protein
MKVEDLLGDNTGEHDDDANVLTVAAMGNSGLLEDLLRAGKDADVGDAKGRTALVSEHTHESRAFAFVVRARPFDPDAVLGDDTRSTSRRPRGTRTACWCYSSTRAM